jgi:hypothetical protein
LIPPSTPPILFSSMFAQGNFSPTPLMGFPQFGAEDRDGRGDQ